MRPDEALNVPVWREMKIAMMRVSNSQNVSVCAWVRSLIEDRLEAEGMVKTWPDIAAYGGGRKPRKDKRAAS